MNAEIFISLFELSEKIYICNYNKIKSFSHRFDNFSVKTSHVLKRK